MSDGHATWRHLPLSRDLNGVVGARIGPGARASGSRPVDVEDNTAVQEPAQDGGRHHGSSKTFPHEPTCKLVVKQMLPFRYLWLMTWKTATAASEASGI